jgi:hypothetical protein
MFSWGFYEARKRVRCLREFVCTSCDVTSYAWVTGVGTGVEPRHLGNLASEGPQADTRAREAAEENADVTVTLATCPRCGAADDEAVRMLQRPYRIVIGMALVAALCVMGWYAFGDRNWFGVIFFALFAPFFAHQFWDRARWQWDTVGERVAFLSDEQVVELVAQQTAEEEAEAARLARKRQARGRGKRVHARLEERRRKRRAEPE